MQCLSYGKPPKTGRSLSTRGEIVAKELKLERSDFVFDHQLNAFHSWRSHEWFSCDLTGENLLSNRCWATDELSCQIVSKPLTSCPVRSLLSHWWARLERNASSSASLFLFFFLFFSFFFFLSSMRTAFQGYRLPICWKKARRHVLDLAHLK